MDSHEQALVLKAQRGDASAFDRLARMHEVRLLHVILGILGDRDDAYDTYQDTLVRAFLRLDSFRFDSAFSTWMTRIAINQALNARKKKQRRQESSIHDEGMVELPSDDGMRATSMERSDISVAIDHAMNTLSDRERAVFVLRHHHDYRLREIAVMLDCAEGTVKNYLFRAVRKMRTALESQYRDLQSA